MAVHSESADILPMAANTPKRKATGTAYEASMADKLPATLAMSPNEIPTPPKSPSRLKRFWSTSIEPTPSRPTKEYKATSRIRYRERVPVQRIHVYANARTPLREANS